MYEYQLAYCRQRMFVTVAWLTLLITVGLTTAGPALSQENSKPVPVVDKGRTGLEFDFPAMKVGIAEYEEGPTGTTVFYFPDGVKAAVAWSHQSSPGMQCLAVFRSFPLRRFG